MRTRHANASMDSIQNGGSVASRLLACNGDTSGLRTNDVLRKDEWKDYDKAVVKAAQQRLIGVADLKSAGLTYAISNGLGKTVLEYEDENDVTAAEMSMSAVTKGLNDVVEYDLNYLPLPITHKDFQINIRKLMASRTTGESLDTTLAALASRKVAEKIEETLFNGASTYTYGGGVIYGYTDSPVRTTGSLNAAWNASAATGATILDDVRRMKQASLDDRHYGPWNLYVPTNFEYVLDDDYVSGYPKTIRQRILEIDGIQSVKVADKLTASNVVLAQMTDDTVRMVEGLPLQTVQWDDEGGMVFKFKVMTIDVPQVRGDQNDRSGIVHFS